jgi:hypothetical protein
LIAVSWGDVPNPRIHKIGTIELAVSDENDALLDFRERRLSLSL